MHPTALPPVHGLDIETDTTVDGLDPTCSEITAVAVASHDDNDRSVVFTGPERELLHALEEHLRSLPPGLIATWNGAGFDLPFLADRAALHSLGADAFGLRLRPDPTIPRRRAPIPGHEFTYRATWGAHRHLDAYRLYRADLGCWFGWSCGLKSVARIVGLPAVVEDRESLHELSAERLRAYVASDAWLTRELTLRRGALAVAAADPA